MVLQGQEPLTILLQGLDYIMKFSIGLPRPSCSTARFQPRVEYVGPLQLVKEVLQKSGVIGITSAEFSHVILHPTTGSTPPTSVEYTLTLHDHAFIKAHPLQVIFLNGTFYIDVDPSPQILRSSARKISSKVPFNTSDHLYRRDHAQALKILLPTLLLGRCIRLDSLDQCTSLLRTVLLIRRSWRLMSHVVSGW